ncbi:MAG TPA: hypothetical protein VHE33_09545 [Acidobacteriaceae bacterium]|nr:hypothetical protein [Acidobacteriaceae bacterium]
MKSILRALALTGIVGFGAAAGAQAQTRFYVGIGTSAVAAIPPCPGEGYVWTAGYYDSYGWVPGQWVYRGYDRDNYYRARVDWDHRYYDHDRDRDRRYDRDRHDRDDHYRGHDRH